MACVQNTFMSHHELPRPLKQRVRAYYEKSWVANTFYRPDSDTLIGVAPPLRRAIHVELKRVRCGCEHCVQLLATP